MFHIITQGLMLTHTQSLACNVYNRSKILTYPCENEKSQYHLGVICLYWNMHTFIKTLNILLDSFHVYFTVLVINLYGAAIQRSHCSHTICKWLFFQEKWVLRSFDFFLLIMNFQKIQNFLLVFSQCRHNELQSEAPH